MGNEPVRIGIDIGGTFTDLVLIDTASGSLHLHKTLTSSPDPSVGALQGLSELLEISGRDMSHVAEILHGTTLVTNAIVERKGARLGMITTAGFRDILAAGTEQRYDIYDLFLKFPEPLVPRQHRLEVVERIDRDGTILSPLDDDEVAAQLARLSAEGTESVAVCFLNAFRNPTHEHRVRDVARAQFPGLSVTLSTEVWAEMGEYQRFVTAAANAFVQPLVARYVSAFEAELRNRGFGGALRLMHSAGGLLAPEVAVQCPIRILESGPAGGALAAALIGAGVGKADAIAFDMGGTTAKASLVEEGRVALADGLEAAREHRFTAGSGLPIKTPVIDLIEIGAGGGSVAWIDEVGLLKVGPLSAGSAPGPACYGLGGTEPTVTDANLLLGYYDPGYFLGGRMLVDTDAAEAAVASLARRLGKSVIEAAAGIHDLVVENMAAAVRIHSVENGRDPRRFAIIGFGGAGPAHVVDVARILGITDVIIPPASGAASALGLLSAPLSFETSRTHRQRIAPDAGFSDALSVLTELERSCRAQMSRAGVEARDIAVEFSADMRLVGQMHKVTVPLAPSHLDAEHMGALRSRFDDVYAQRYAPPLGDMACEIVALRARCVGPVPDVPFNASGAAGAGSALKGCRKAWFDGAFVETPVYDRYAAAPGTAFAGPAIVEEQEATSVIPPGCSVEVDAQGNLRIAIGSARSTDLGIGRDMPLETAMARIESDPTALEIMWSRAVNVTEEMWQTVCRTAFSLVISEAQDFACDLLDVTGDTLAHSPRAMPVFNLTLPMAAKALLANFPVDTLVPGDVLVTNDPWLCAGHLFDIAVVTPIFRDGRVVALAGTVGNVSDIGGTRDWLAAREVYEEGVQIPPMKLTEAGVPNAALWTLLEKNVRGSEQVLGDIASFMAANEIGARRLLALMDDHGLEDLNAFAAVVQTRSEAAMRAAIRALPDGTYSADTWNNPFGTPLRYEVAVQVAGDRIDVEFSSAPPQAPRGGINCTMSYTAAHATYPLKCLLTPRVRGNAGCYRPLRVTAPEGTLLNARYPASVNLRTRTGWYIAPGIFNALADAVPGSVQAATGLPFTSNIYGHEPDGSTYADVLFAGGGQGASAAADGKSGLLWPTSAANTSIELLESRVPVLVLEKSFVPDSGAPGRCRGGLAQRVRFRKLKDDGAPMLATIYPEGVTHPASGLFGGASAAAARGVVTGPDGKVLRDCSGGVLVELTGTDQTVDVTVSSGAGFGPSADRPREAMARDLQAGLVTAEGLRRDYHPDEVKQAEASRLGQNEVDKEELIK